MKYSSCTLPFILVVLYMEIYYRGFELLISTGHGIKQGIWAQNDTWTQTHCHNNSSNNLIFILENDHIYSFHENPTFN